MDPLTELYVSRRDKMRRFAEKSHIELLISVERDGNVQGMEFWKNYGILERKFHIWKNYGI